VLRVTRIAWDAEDRVIEFARDLFRGDRLLFVSDTDQTTEDQQESRKHERFSGGAVFGDGTTVG
jgi:hypothetical protein